MVYILNQHNSFIPPKNHAVVVTFKHEINYIECVVKSHNEIMCMSGIKNLMVEEFDLLKQYPQLCWDNIPIPSKTRTCDSDDIIIIPLGMDCYNCISFKPYNNRRYRVL